MSSLGHAFAIQNNWNLMQLFLGQDYGLKSNCRQSQGFPPIASAGVNGRITSTKMYSDWS